MRVLLNIGKGMLFMVGLFSLVLIVLGLLQGARFESLVLPLVVLAIALIVVLPSGRRKVQERKQPAKQTVTVERSRGK